MKVVPYKDAIMVEPETEFEEEWLQSFRLGDVFHKCRDGTTHYIGIKIKRKEDGNE